MFLGLFLIANQAGSATLSLPTTLITTPTTPSDSIKEFLGWANAYIETEKSLHPIPDVSMEAASFISYVAGVSDVSSERIPASVSLTQVATDVAQYSLSHKESLYAYNLPAPFIIDYLKIKYSDKKVTPKYFLPSNTLIDQMTAYMSASMHRSSPAVYIKSITFVGYITGVYEGLDAFGLTTSVDVEQCIAIVQDAVNVEDTKYKLKKLDETPANALITQLCFLNQ